MPKNYKKTINLKKIIERYGLNRERALEIIKSQGWEPIPNFQTLTYDFETVDAHFQGQPKSLDEIIEANLLKPSKEKSEASFTPIKSSAQVTKEYMDACVASEKKSANGGNSYAKQLGEVLKIVLKRMGNEAFSKIDLIVMSTATATNHSISLNDQTEFYDGWLTTMEANGRLTKTLGAYDWPVFNLV